MYDSLPNSNQSNTSLVNHSNNSQDDIFDLSELLDLLRKRKFLIFSVTFLLVILSVIFLSLTIPKYTSSLSLLVQVKSNNIVDIESVVTGISGDDAAIQSELDVLQSRKLISRVIEKLGLVNKPEFNPSLSQPSLLDLGVNYVKDLFFPIEVNINKKDQLLKSKYIVFNNVLNNLSVARKIKSYTVKIGFTSEDPKLAAAFANALAEEYTLNQLDAKFEASKKANVWLNNKLVDLQEKVRSSDLAVEEFRKKNNLIESDGKGLNEQQLSELNSLLVIARTERAQAQSRLNIAKNSIDASTEVLDSRLIQSLRSQEAEVLRKKSDLQGRYGEKHPKMVNVKRELKDLRQKISEEITKVRNSLTNEVRIARTRERSLEKNLKSLTKDTSVSNVARVKLDELVRDLNANKSLYESFLLRFKEVNQNMDLQQADAQVISQAETPYLPSFPNKKLVLILSVIFGFGLGVVFAFLLEILDNTFTTSTQLERITNIKSIGIIPELKKRQDFRKVLADSKASTYSESLRSVLTAIRFSDIEKKRKSLMVTSSTHSEGKSSFVISLATLMAKSGSTVLIVDCDFRRPSINKKLKHKSKNGLVEVITDEVSEDAVISKDEKGGFDFIGCANPNITNSQDLLNSKQMEDFVERVSAKYDMVIFDTPPVMAVSDSLTVSKLVDSCVFMVRSEKTTKQFVNSSLRQMQYCNVDLIGTILTRVKLDKTKKYSYGRDYYYGQYTAYES